MSYHCYMEFNDYVIDSKSTRQGGAPYLHGGLLEPDQLEVCRQPDVGASVNVEVCGWGGAEGLVCGVLHVRRLPVLQVQVARLVPHHVVQVHGRDAHTACTYLHHGLGEGHHRSMLNFKFNLILIH